MNPRTACTFWLTLILLPLSAAGARAVDREAAAGYLAQARLLAETGARTQALGLLDTALEFFPGFSEAEYLYGRILLAEQAGTRPGIERLPAASGPVSGAGPAALPGRPAVVPCPGPFAGRPAADCTGAGGPATRPSEP